MLHSMRCFDRAALFLEACLQNSAIEISDETNKLISAVFADYARILRSIGFIQGALRFAQKSGDAGAELASELQSNKSEDEK